MDGDFPNNVGVEHLGIQDGIITLNQELRGLLANVLLIAESRCGSEKSRKSLVKSANLGPIASDMMRRLIRHGPFAAVKDAFERIIELFRGILFTGLDLIFIP